MPTLQEEFEERKKTLAQEYADFKAGEIRVPPPLTAGEVAKSAVEKFPESLSEAGVDVFKALTHPIETTKAIGEFVIGGLQKATSFEGPEIIDGKVMTPPQEQKFNALIDYYSESYGGVENIKRTIATKPAYFLMDSAAILGGSGALLRAGGLGRAGAVVSKVGRAIDPVLGTARLGKKAIKGTGQAIGETLGITTGAGKAAIQEAYKIEFPKTGTYNNPVEFWRKTKALNKGFKDALRGKTGEIEIFAQTTQAMDNVMEARTANYVKNLDVLKSSKNPVKLEPLFVKLDKLKERFFVKGDTAELLSSPKALREALRKSTFTKGDYAVVGEAFRAIDDWVKDPTLQTPFGMDVLKRKLDSLYKQNETSRAFIGELRSTVKDIAVKGLGKDAPAYIKMQKDFSEFSAIIDDIKRTLSLKGPKGQINADTVLSKLTTSIRTNKPFRRSMVDLLEEHSGIELTQSIAGTLLEPALPAGHLGRVLTGVGVLAGGMSYFLGPEFAAIMLMASPRAVGEFTRAFAKITLPIVEIGKRIPTQTGQATFQAGRLQQIQQDVGQP